MVYDQTYRKMTNTDCWATFHGIGGYTMQNINANQRLTIGKKYKVIGGKINRFDTSLVLEGVEGHYNSVMFDIEGELPFKFEDAYTDTYHK